MTKRVRRVLGMTFDGKPIFEPPTSGSSLVYAAAGGGKTTCVAVTAVQSLIADKGRAIFLNDVKKGEIAAQIGPMCIKHGRPFGVVDEFGELGEDYPHRINLNPFGSVVDAAQNAPGHLPFVIDTIANALIDEPKDDQKNFYWRETPRQFLCVGIDVLVANQPKACTPGGLHILMSDPHTWISALEIEAEEGNERTRPAALQILELKNTNPEHYTQHLNAALTSLKIFGFDPLLSAGRNPDLTHADLIRDGWIVCFVNPVRHTDRLGPFFALHFLALMDAQLSSRLGRAEYILDEFCNAPLRAALERVTVFRAFGARAHYIAQSRMDAVRKYGEKEIALLEENCTIKQYLKFSNIEEAQRISKAMGETLNVGQGLGFTSGKSDFSGNFSTGKDPVFAADELMRLPPDEQIIQVVDVGWIHCKKVRQNQLAPTCFDLSDNPLEGAPLPPDPKIVLPTGSEA